MGGAANTAHAFSRGDGILSRTVTPILKNPGIYILTNRVNGKQYVGKDSKLPFRVNEHFKGSYKGSRLLDTAVKKYGIENFGIEVIPYLGISPESLYAVEQWKIAALDTKSPNGYNLTDGGPGVMNPSEETRRKKSDSMKKFHQENPPENQSWRSDEWKQKLSDAKKQHWKNPEYRALKTQQAKEQANRGLRKHSEETKRKITQNHGLRRKRLKAEWMWIRSLAMCWYEMHDSVMKRRSEFLSNEIPDMSQAEQNYFL